MSTILGFDSVSMLQHHHSWLEQFFLLQINGFYNKGQIRQKCPRTKLKLCFLFQSILVLQSAILHLSPLGSGHVIAYPINYQP